MGWKSKFILITKYNLLFMSVLMHFFQYSAEVCLIPPEMFFFENWAIKIWCFQTCLKEYNCLGLFDSLGFMFYIISQNSFCRCSGLQYICPSIMWENVLTLSPAILCVGLWGSTWEEQRAKLFFLIVLRLLPSELEFMLSVDFVSWDCSKDIMARMG